MTVALFGWPLKGDWTAVMYLKHPTQSLWLSCRTNWKARRRVIAFKAASTAATPPTIDDGFLTQKKRERGIAEKSNQALVLDILAASATSRDARAYLNIFGPQKTARGPKRIPPTTSNVAGINLGKLFSHALDVTTANRADNISPEQATETLHVALVKIRAPQSLDDATLRGVMHTLEQLSHLGMQIVVVVDCDSETTWKDPVDFNNLALEQTDRIVNAIGSLHGAGARKLVSLISFVSNNQGQTTGRLCVSSRNLLLSPLRRGRICVVAPIGFNSTTTKDESLSGNEVLLTLAREFVGIPTMQQHEDDDQLAQKIQSLQSEVSLDRIIILDPLGGTPHGNRGRAHRYINLEQEYDGLIGTSSQDPTSQTVRHMDNLSLMKSALAFLPSSSSGFITTPSAVAKADVNSQHADPNPPISTRSQRNLLIHNLLTNKPAVSFSLPQHRQESSSTSDPGNVSTLFKRGMSLTVIPEIPPGGWTCPAPQQEKWTGNVRLGLRNPMIDYQRLTYLINDSFGRTLDVRAYDERTRNSLAGIIIAGDYQGAAIFTWELPPPESNIGAPSHPWVPYLDKFAVLRSAQGSATADVLWNAMSEAFPHGFCWRSRTVNPVNKWYFERAQGSLQLKGTQWTMFWSQKGTLNDDADQKEWRAFLGVCESVKPSWKDPKAVD